MLVSGLEGFQLVQRHGSIERMHIVKDNNVQSLRNLLLRGCSEENDTNLLQGWLDKFRAVYNVNIEIDANQILRQPHAGQRGWQITGIDNIETGDCIRLSDPCITTIEDRDIRDRDPSCFAGLISLLCNRRRHDLTTVTYDYNHNHDNKYNTSWLRLSDNTYGNDRINSSLSILLSPTGGMLIAKYRQQQVV
jgi:hypothetical protein